MKFTALASIAALAIASVVSAQDGACQTCLQTSLKALPLCASVNITIGNYFDSAASPEYAACLCQSTSGAWIDSCIAAKTCTDDILSFKAAYAESLAEMGLNCNGTTPTIVPVPSASVAPSSALPSGTGAGGASPTSGGASPTSAGNVNGPSFLLAETMGVLAVAAAIGASFL
ncbi:hypothetical protein BGW39_001212 [Mortierella sp. 14UC]|nr:hypothetical protein BGW39_001212 [Mortierella sp. 14UC]